MKKQKFLQKSCMALCVICALLTFILVAGNTFVTKAESLKEIEKFDYSTYNKSDEYYLTILDFNRKTDGIYINNIKYNETIKYLYIFLQSAGGSGGYDAVTKKIGYGGGSGCFIALRVDMSNCSLLTVATSYGGGKMPAYDPSPNEIPKFEYGEGYWSGISAVGSGQEPYSLMFLYGGKPGTVSAPGKGGTFLGSVSYSYVEILEKRNGLDGGMYSSAFDVEINEPGYKPFKKSFGHNISGFAWSGIGGAASPFAKGGDGGVWLNNGQDGSYGSGGGGAGLGGDKAGYGGDGYVEIYIAH